MSFHIILVDRAPWISSDDILLVMLLLTYSVLLRYCPAKKVMRGEANILLRASAERLRKNKKHDLKCSFSNAHGFKAKYWTVRPVSPRAGVGMRYLERLTLVSRY